MEIRTARGLGRLVGLLGRRDPGVVLHLPRCRSVHTFGMRFPLDLVWLDGAGEVVRVDRGVPPFRVRSCRAARSVLELRSEAVYGSACAEKPSTGARAARSRVRGASGVR